MDAWSWPAKALLVLALLSGAAGVGWSQGVRFTAARWKAADVDRERAETDQRREDARIARAASREFEVWRADRARRDREIASALEKALQRPISCPASGVLGDLVVPGDVVDGLRDAGRDDPAGTAGGEPTAGL